MKIATGTRIKHYEILSALGAGGMGEVYLAEDQQLGRKVAIKFLPAEVATDERARQRLLKEAKTAATLDHTNICAIYEVGEDDGRSFIVLQYIEGETLAARLKRQLPDLWEALAITAEEGFPCYPLFEGDANLASLRNDARFILFMAKLKQRWQHYDATL